MTADTILAEADSPQEVIDAYSMAIDAAEAAHQRALDAGDGPDWPDAVVNLDNALATLAAYREAVQRINAAIDLHQQAQSN